MSAADEPSETDEQDSWAELAEYRDALEMCIDEDVPFAERAERLLERLEDEGY